MQKFTEYIEELLNFFARLAENMSLQIDMFRREIPALHY